jgi:hypothetical protein
VTHADATGQGRAVCPGCSLVASRGVSPLGLETAGDTDGAIRVNAHVTGQIGRCR